MVFLIYGFSFLLLLAGGSPSTGNAKCARTHLGGGHPDGVPVDAWQDVDQEAGVVGDVALFELGVLVMQREAEWGGFAGFDGASQKGCREDFHSPRVLCGE